MSSTAGQHDEIYPATVDGPGKSVRQGTKSCTECRHRKVRCVWPGEGATTCQGCLARRKTCEVQLRMRRTAETVSGTSRARVKHLEDEVSSLWSVVRELEAKVNSGEHGQFSLPSRSETHRPVVSPNDVPSDDEEGSDSEGSGISTTNTPSHLLNLFDNGLLDSESRGSESMKPSRIHPNSKHLHNITTLRNLIPNREVMVKVVAYASPWLSVYNLLFPQTNMMKTGQQLLDRYDRLSVSNPDLLEAASLLIAVALTVQQFPDEFQGDGQDRIKNASSFVSEVNNLLERVVVHDDILAGTLDGIGTTLLYLRLQLGHAPVSKMWLTLRRIVALAELNGLPRATLALNKYDESISGTQGGAKISADPSAIALWRCKAEVWASICAIDRIQSLMWSLPLATANYPLPKRPIVDANGQVDAQAYQYSVIEIAARILEIDNLVQAGRPMEEVFQVVVETDQQLRTIDSLTPKGWQRIEWSEFSIYAILQYWQQYITIRIHLQLALKYDGRDFTFNFVTCLSAAQELTRRYISLRPLLAPGFFANRVLDLQAFTAMAFLLLAVCRGSYSAGSLFQTVDTEMLLGLVDGGVETMRQAATRAAGDFARQAADSICSLRSLLMQPHASENQKITLHLALIGTIHVSRKAQPTSNVLSNPLPSSQQPEMSWQPSTSTSGIAHDHTIPLFDPSGNGLMDSLSFSMEMPESYPLFADQTSGSEPWLTWSGWDGNS
ncbi:hypothetical protein VTL71DRAFT_3762 [Oculimacula yallundae]|uniref:Zn(2)-C6 fungal-type domain-containing protein n=1 Tax=Oculimacula yallundae TaxID=86028 RepID=A0ABR4C3Z3_9HELO